MQIMTILSEFHKKHRCHILLLCVALFAIWMIKIDIIDYIKTEAIIINPVSPTGTYELASGMTVKESFIAASQFDTVLLLSDERYSGEIDIEVKNMDSGEVVYGTVVDPTITTDSFITWKYWIHCPIQDLENGQTLEKGNYEVSITNRGERPLKICMAGNGLRSVQDFDNDGKKLEVSISVKTNIGYVVTGIVCVLIVAYIVVLYFIYTRKKLTSCVFFLITFVTLTSIFLVMFAPWTYCDATQHYYAAFRIANLWMGVGDSNPWVGRAEDAYFLNYVWGNGAGGFINPSLSTYEIIVSNFNANCGGELTDLPYTMDYMKFFSALNYIPYICGIVIGRIIGLGALPSIYMGRILGAFLYGTLIYRAIKIMPIGKNALSLVLLLPNSILSLCECTYDSLVLVSSASFIANVFRLKNDGGNKAALVEACIWGFLLGAAKGGGYLLLLPLALMLLENKERKSRTYAFLIFVSGLVSIVLWDVIFQESSNSKLFFSGNEGTYTVSFALHHPCRYIVMFLKTMFRMDNSAKYFRQIFGGLLGWDIENTLPFLLMVLLAVILGKAVYFEKSDVVISKWQAGMMTIAVIAVIVFTPASVLVSTMLNSDVISGIQGRYFLPIVPLIYLVVEKYQKGKSSYPLTLNQEKGNLFEAKALLAFGIVSCIAVLYVLRIYVTR